MLNERKRLDIIKEYYVIHEPTPDLVRRGRDKSEWCAVEWLVGGLGGGIRYPGLYLFS